MAAGRRGAIDEQVSCHGFLNDFNTLDPCADVNADGTVDFDDFLAFLSGFNAGC